jgi:hypothetical protein
MVMGNELVSWKLNSGSENGFVPRPRYNKIVKWDSVTKAYYEVMNFGTIIEYDQNGDVVWSWKSSGYFKNSDIYSSMSPVGTFYVHDVHANAFFFDEMSKNIYVSFKNISRILKVQYPGGKVTNVYGDKYDNGKPEASGPDLFMGQHSCRISADGYLYLFNNNPRYSGSLPTLLMLQEPRTDKDALKKVWEYQCTTDGIDTAVRRPPDLSSLGSVSELPDHSFIACMASSRYTRAFIVNRDKKVLWSAMPEHWNETIQKWEPITQYRVNMITDRKDMEILIWASEANMK